MNDKAKAPAQNNANSTIQTPQSTLSPIEQKRINTWKYKTEEENIGFAYKVRKKKGPTTLIETDFGSRNTLSDIQKAETQHALQCRYLNLRTTIPIKKGALSLLPLLNHCEIDATVPPILSSLSHHLHLALINVIPNV